MSRVSGASEFSPAFQSREGVGNSVGVASATIESSKSSLNRRWRDAILVLTFCSRRWNAGLNSSRR